MQVRGWLNATCRQLIAIVLWEKLSLEINNKKKPQTLAYFRSSTSIVNDFPEAPLSSQAHGLSQIMFIIIKTVFNVFVQVHVTNIRCFPCFCKPKPTRQKLRKSQSSWHIMRNLEQKTSIVEKWSFFGRLLSVNHILRTNFSMFMIHASAHSKQPVQFDNISNKVFRME